MTGPAQPPLGDAVELVGGVLAVKQWFTSVPSGALALVFAATGDRRERLKDDAVTEQRRDVGMAEGW